MSLSVVVLVGHPIESLISLGGCGELRSLQSIRENQATDFRNRMIAVALQQVHYLTAKGVVIE
jgi:hypothetical protein